MKGSIDIKRINSRLERIANVLSLNASFIENLGLLNGKMGIAIFFFHYARYTNNKIFENYADELVDEIYGEINKSISIDFENGVTGIGWGIEYLVKNGFVQADTDEALSEIDSVIYRARINSPILITDGKDLFGYGHYYVSRLTGNEINDNDLDTLIKKYHLIFLIDECERILVQNHFKGFNIESLSVNTINSLIWFILEVNRLEIFPSKTNELMQIIPGFIKSLNLESINVSGLKQLRTLMTFMKPLIHEPAGINPAKDKTDKETLEMFDFESSEVKIESFIKNSWQRIVYEPYVARKMETGDFYNNTFLLKDIEESWSQILETLDKNSFGLTGLAGLGLGLLMDNERISPKTN
jgi:hypothetical protein